MINGENWIKSSKSHAGYGVTSKSFWNPQLWLACVWREGRAFFTLKDVKRHWLLPLASAVALGGPVLAGAWSQSLNAGMTASLGALIFLYLPQSTFPHMWRSMVWSSVVMLACYGIGSFSSSIPFLQVPGLVFLTSLATLYCKNRNVGGPPGSLFFVIAHQKVRKVARVCVMTGRGWNREKNTNP